LSVNQQNRSSAASSDVGSAPISVALRVDADERIGTGHLIRCLTLADALARHGARAHFISRGLAPRLCALVAERGHQLTTLEACDSAGCAEEDDAAQTLRALGAQAWSWIVVDHYELGQPWEQRVRTLGRVLAIDDLANRPHACDLLLDQNLVSAISTRYAGLVPEACGVLLGPTYALLDPLYADLHDRVPPREGAIERVLISFGGFDPDFLTERALEALIDVKRPEVEVDVVMADEIRAAEIERRSRADQHIHVHRHLATLAPLMVGADLAIGAAGSTTWERLCLGLPTLVVTFADNQTPIAEELQRRGLARWLGHSHDVDTSTFAGALEPLLHDELDVDWSRRCAAAVAGRGTSRVCAALTVSPATGLTVRLARVEDEALLLDWANDPVTRRNAFSPGPIPAATHHAWFRNRLREVDACHFYIVEAQDGMPVGQVRFQRHEVRWELHYAVSPVFRARGLGKRVLNASLGALREACGQTTVFGQVNPTNERSCRIFEGLGFEKLATTGTAGSVVYERTL
jgi:UDP-2,4-diacetamido-2,4,6-trideoxy-beta-L-altropyranose hydrolase